MSGASEDGEALLAIRAGGDLVGELAALDGRPRLATVVTAGPVIARIIGRDEFVTFLARTPDVGLAITKEIADKLRSAAAPRIDFASYGAPVRLARVLLELATRYGERTSTGTVIRCPLTQTELAALAAVAEPTVQRVLRQLLRDRVITTGYRDTTVLDMAGLRQRAFPSAIPPQLQPRMTEKNSPRASCNWKRSTSS